MVRAVLSPADPTEDMDAVDCKILRTLQENAKLSFNKLARKVDISVGTAYNRVKHLEAQGLIKGYSARIDSSKLGFSLTAIIFVKAQSGYLAPVAKKISQDKNVISVYEVTGDFDAVVIAKFTDRETLSKYMKHLAAMPNIKRATMNVALNTVKEDFRILLPPNFKP
ncbi:MAG: Lrp/AsnC family transcriptional regulator [Candidatus Bathyarchaeota archaeon]|nr:Lrp/AsnC family transcriptional regulator [Candidatus Bathyarchaeota archaeon]